jgi:hypothetical protein
MEILELEQHIRNFKSMYKEEMRLARANSQYLLDGIQAAKAEIEDIKRKQNPLEEVE